MMRAMRTVAFIHGEAGHEAETDEIFHARRVKPAISILIENNEAEIPNRTDESFFLCAGGNEAAASQFGMLYSIKRNLVTVVWSNLEVFSWTPAVTSDIVAASKRV